MRVFAICLSVVFLAACAKIRKPTSEPPTSIMGNASLTLIQTIPLPGVEGRIDHLSVDIKDQRLFVAALGNNTVEVINLKTGTLIHSITGLSEPQSALFIPANNKLFVTEGGNGLCQIFDGTSFVELGRVQLAGDADNIRYDSSSKFVIVGYGEGGLSFIDTAAGQELTHIDLAGHPEAFQLESSGSRIFVNIPSSNQIAVVDRGQAKVISTWLMTSALANFPMALDEARHRLFVGFRLPAKLGIFDTETGTEVASFDSVGDTDDIFYDAAQQLIFVIGGDGYVDVFSQQDADHYQLASQISTGSGARTGLWIPDWNRLYVAVPHRAGQDAEIQVYELQP